jgi:hypothetical protein
MMIIDYWLVLDSYHWLPWLSSLIIIVDYCDYWLELIILTIIWTTVVDMKLIQ